MKLRSAYFLLALLAVVFAGCKTVPITGRRQLAYIPESQMVALSESSYNEFIANSKLSTDKKQIEILIRVGNKISSATENFLREEGCEADLKYYNWEYNLIDDTGTINAFAMPGGKIAFYTGIMNLAQTDDQIAVVMGHEIAHAVAKHGNERMSQLLLVEMGGMALETALSKQPQQTKDLFLSTYGIGAQVGVILPYSRKQEYEADEIGLILMAKAGYEPEAAITFWEKMRALGGARPPEFLSTHPATDARIENLKRLIPEARKYLKK